VSLHFPRHSYSRANDDMGINAQHCSFVLLAEFDIDRGAQLTYQFPQPLGTDEGCVTSQIVRPEPHLNPLEQWRIKAFGQLDVARRR
jgi:hypothetical protein